MDGIDIKTPGCECPPETTGPWDCTDCPVHSAEANAFMEAEAAAERHAEEGWLRAAEYDPEQAAFEEYEARMGLL